MPYRIHTNGVIECDTADECRALMRHSDATPKAAAVETSENGTVRRRRRKRRRRSSGPSVPTFRKRSADANKAVSKSWADAKKLAEKEGISVKEARSKLAKGKG